MWSTNDQFTAAGDFVRGEGGEKLSPTVHDGGDVD